MDNISIISGLLPLLFHPDYFGMGMGRDGQKKVRQVAALPDRFQINIH